MKDKWIQLALRLAEATAAYRHPDVLIIDEVGYIPFDQDNPLDYLKALPGAPEPPVAQIPLPSLSARALLSR